MIGQSRDRDHLTFCDTGDVRDGRPPKRLV